MTQDVGGLSPRDITQLPDLATGTSRVGPVRTRMPIYVDLLPPCNAGCPACVGPVLAAQEEEKGPTPRSLALTVLSLLSAERCDQVPTIVVDEALDLLP